MKIIINKTHIKTVSKRFEPIKDQLEDLILYEEYKRPYKEEKEVFERALLAYYFELMMEELKTKQPHAWEYFSESKPIQLIKTQSSEWMVWLEKGKACWVEKKDFPNVMIEDHTNDVDFEQLKLEIDDGN